VRVVLAVARSAVALVRLAFAVAVADLAVVWFAVAVAKADVASSRADLVADFASTNESYSLVALARAEMLATSAARIALALAMSSASKEISCFKGPMRFARSGRSEETLASSDVSLDWYPDSIDSREEISDSEGSDVDDSNLEP
jgi:hypothetical protein